LVELIFQAVVEKRETEAIRAVEQALDPRHVQQQLVALDRRVEVSHVRALLTSLRQQREQAELMRMMPAYIRRFFQQAAPLVGVQLGGDVEGLFWLEHYPASLQAALSLYPSELHHRLTFDRALALPDLARDPEAVYLHPGEPLFEALTTLFLGQYEAQGMRGALFFDPDADGPALFAVAAVRVVCEPQSEGEPEVVAEHVVGVRARPNGQFDLLPAHWLLTLFPGEGEPIPATPDVGQLVVLASTPTLMEGFLLEQLGVPSLEAYRQAEEKRLPDRRNQIQVAYNLWQGELLEKRKRLREAVSRGVPAAGTKLRECETELETVDRRRREAEAALYQAVDSVRLAPVTFYAQALVLPLPPEEVTRRREVRAEQIALDEVRRREEAEGSIIEDVSAPHLASGYDWHITRADGSTRLVEIKGRSGQAAIELTENEWRQAVNQRERYWLYVVYNCDTVPTLHRVADPFGRVLARETGSIRINASEIMAAATE
jgi:hypothetical protein